MKGLAVILLIVALSQPGNGKRTKDKIYIDLQTQNACFRVLNGTHQFGCSSNLNGNVGILQYIETEEDFEFLLQTGPYPPYVALLKSKDFNLTIVRELVDSGRVNGILLENILNDSSVSSPPLEGFSADRPCPNNKYGSYFNNSEYSDCKAITWNEPGSSMFFQDYSIPIFAISSPDDLDNLIRKCYYTFNRPVNGTARNFPLCAVELMDRMEAAVDTETCIRRSNLITNLNPDNKQCDPLGDQNVIATVKPIDSNATRPAKSVIVMATRMDSFSMFHNEYQSADTSAMGIIALLAAAEALGKVQEDIRNNSSFKDIMFTFFQGEAFDYIGSSRMIYDMGKNSFPKKIEKDTVGLSLINLTHIDSFIELGQIGLRDEGKLWLHSDPITRGNFPNISRKVEEIINLTQSIGQEVGVDFDEVRQSQPLPPASIQRFLRKLALPAVVVTDHQKTFTNKYYNSRYDLPVLINASYPDTVNKSDRYDYHTDQAYQLTNVSTTLARLLYRLSTGNDPSKNITANLTTVSHLLFCFLHDPHCELFNQSIDDADAKSLADAKKPFPFYVSVSYQTNQITSLTRLILAQFLGTRVSVSKKEDCKQPDKYKTYSYTWMQGAKVPGSDSGKREGWCFKSMTYLSTAKSPAFDIDNYDWRSGEYSTYSESVWKPLKVRVFLVPSQQFETITLSVGVVLLLISLLLVYFLNMRADVIFANRLSAYRHY